MHVSSVAPAPYSIRAHRTDERTHIEFLGDLDASSILALHAAAAAAVRHSRALTLDCRDVLHTGVADAGGLRLLLMAVEAQGVSVELIPPRSRTVRRTFTLVELSEHFA